MIIIIIVIIIIIIITNIIAILIHTDFGPNPYRHQKTDRVP